MLVLALESSTSAAKALLYDTVKGVVDMKQLSYPVSFGSGAMGTEEVFDITMKVGRLVAEGQDISAIGICGIWHSVAVCDQNLKPITPTYAWNYTGAAEMCRQLRKDENLVSELYERTGCMLHSLYPRHILQYLNKQGLDFSNGKLMSQGAFNFFKLTDVFCESISTASGSGFVNTHSLKYDDFIMDKVGIKEQQMGALATYKDVSELNSYGASRLGIKPGIPVVPAHPDGALNQVGNFANRPEIMTLSVGTSGALRVIAPRPVLPKGHQLWCYYGADSWVSGAAVSGACNCINWFADHYLDKKWSFEELENAVSDTEEPPVFLPFLFGERCPGWGDDKKGGFFDITGTHNVGDFYLAIQMGILFNLYQCYKILCGENGEPNQIIVSGGIINSPKWTKMLSDIFKKEILVADNPNASLMGAVALALHAAGALDDINGFRNDFDSAIAVSPDQARYDFYDRQFERYLDFYNK